ncbi:MAG: OmpA family protein [Treponema sp.]|nr:OmpA family protein [Treponema sp.]
MKNKLAFLSLIFAGGILFAQGQLFQFKYKEGDAYRVLSTVQEDVFFNDVFHHHAEILNRVSVRVTGIDDKGRGIHDAIFMTSENSTGARGGVFTYGEDYKSVFARDAAGRYDISDEYFMPVVRDVPIFPAEEIEVGHKWTAQGHEAHDLRRTFDIKTPYKIPFNAEYEYLGEVQEEGKTFYKFDVQYEMEYSVDMKKFNFVKGEVPVATQGYSHQIIWWDNDKGCIDHYREEFRIEILTSSNNILRFEGTAHAEVTDFARTADEKNVAAVIEKINDLGIDDVSVTAGEKGLTLSIENIQFKPDSDILLQSERAKLDKIAQILNAYPDNDLLITGHTALRGTKESRQKLSEERAQAVANYLIRKNVRDKYHVFTKGMGGDVPIADNSTEAGRAKNRRVEITIMDK